jgi:steroid delta-isomerase-like uncharacterized protein
MSPHISPELSVLANRYAAAWNSHDVDAIMAFHADDTSYRMNGSKDAQRGKAELRATFARQLAAVPDIAFDLTSLHGGAEHFVLEARITGTRVDGKASIS